MPAGPPNNPPVTSHSHHRFVVDGGELRLCLQSESSNGGDGSPHMSVEFNLNLFARYSSEPLILCNDLTVDDVDPSLLFSTLEASQVAVEPLITTGWPQQDEILGLLGPDIARAVHATAKSAGALGHTAMKVVADAACTKWVDLGLIEMFHEHPRFRPDGEESELLGTCVVCFEEVKLEWRWPVRLSCSHAFHMECLLGWLERNGSCPLCRSAVHLRGGCF